MSGGASEETAASTAAAAAAQAAQAQAASSPAAPEDDKTTVAEPGSSNSSASAGGKMGEGEALTAGKEQPGRAAAQMSDDENEAEEEEEEDGEAMEGEEEAGGEDSDEYEYVYDDGDDAFDAEGVGGGAGGGGAASSSAFASSSHVVFTGLDTIGNTNDMLLKKELTRVKADLEKTRRWKVDLTWAEETRTLGVMLEHEGFIKAHLNLSFPATYPTEPPQFQFLGPRFDDTVDFVLGADVFEPCRKENWNDTFTCTNLLMVVMELVKDKYPITDELAFDDFESTLIAICRSRLPGIPRKVKEGLVYFGVRLEPKEKGAKRASSGVGYSMGARSTQHDFSVHDKRFKEHLDAFGKLLTLARDEGATSVALARVAHVHLAAWLQQYLEEELPIFKYEEAHDLIAQAIVLLQRVDPEAEELPRIQAIHEEREALLRPQLGGAGRRRRTGSGVGSAAAGADAAAAEGEGAGDGEEEVEYVFSVEDEFAQHQYKAEAAAAANSTPSMEVMKRIMLEVENLRDHLRGMTDGQIFVCFSEASCLLWKVLIIPSSGTPYYGGCFEFHLSIPADYPNHPPKCLFMTTGGGQVRFNPNLYNNGAIFFGAGGCVLVVGCAFWSFFCRLPACLPACLC